MVRFERSYLTSLIFAQIVEKDQVKLILKFYEELSFDAQCVFFALLGTSLNEDLYKYKLSKLSDVNCKDLNLEDLKKASKGCFYLGHLQCRFYRSMLTPHVYLMPELGAVRLHGRGGGLLGYMVTGLI